MRQRTTRGWLPVRVAIGLGTVLAVGLADPASPMPAGPQSRTPVPAPPLQAPRSEPDQPSHDWLERLQTWVRATRDHRSGSMDESVLATASFSRRQLFALRTDLRELRERLVREHRHRRTSGVLGEISYGGRTIDARDLQRLLGLDDQDAAAGDLNVLLRRGASLHTDIAYHAPPALASATGDASILLRDGQHIGYGYSGLHWEFARALLDLTWPSASLDSKVRQWYIAAGALMRRQYSYGYSGPHLERARVIFPGDAQLLFLSGCLHEALAAPRVQSYVRAADLPGGKVSSSGAELRRAEGFLRRSVELAPDSVDAHLRLGRVLGLLARPADAVTELNQALELTTDDTLIYFAALLLGDAEQALGHRDRAQSAYQRALTQFPDAQSVHLALAQLARGFGDRPAALATMDRLFDLPARPDLRHDPWWRYFAGTIETDEELLLALWGALDGEDQP